MNEKSDDERNRGQSYHRPEVSIEDEPGAEERFQRGLQRALNTPPQHRAKLKPMPKAKERPASKGRIHKGKTRS
jgi:hypothetical protein